MIEKFFTAKSKDVYLLTTVANFMYKIQAWLLILVILLTYFVFVTNLMLITFIWQ